MNHVKKKLGVGGESESAMRTSRHMGPIIITLSTISPTYLFALLLPPSFSFLSIPILQLNLPHLSIQNTPFLSQLLQLVQESLSLFLSVSELMEGTLGLLGGGSSGCSTNESTMSKVDHQVVEQDYVGMSSEVSSYPAEAELELGLGLSLGGGGSAQKPKPCAWGERGRILTAKDFPSMVSHESSRFSQRPNNVSGNKRAADSVSQEGGSPTAVSPVVGWPPISAARMNSLVNQTKTSRAEDDKADGDKSKDTFKKKINTGNKSTVKEKGHLGFVKVNMDGIPIGRKVDLNSHTCYETLAQTLEDMFFSTTTTVNAIGGDKEQATKPSRLLDGSSEFVLTYEDKEGDWMLMGDVPWRMFLTSVKRLRIMRTSEANGLAPRFQEMSERQRNKPI